MAKKAKKVVAIDVDQRFVDFVKAKIKSGNIDNVEARLVDYDDPKLSDNEFKAALGALKKKLIIEIKNGKIMFSGNKEELSKKSLEEKFIEILPVEFDKLTDEDIYQVYISDPNAYFELNKTVRGTPNGFTIKGIKQKNLNLCGVYVNDAGSISCKKEDVNEKTIKDYTIKI